MRPGLAVTGAFFAILCLLTTGHAVADNAPPCKYAAEFTQSRMVSGLPVPLVSTGALLVDCEQGLVWQTTDPIRQSIIYTATPHHFRVTDGREVDLLDDLVNRNMATTLLPMLGGNLEALDGQFDISEAGNTIALAPRDSATRRFLKQIEAVQETNGAVVTILDGNDLTTTITISDLQSLDVVDNARCETTLSDGEAACRALLFPAETAAGLVSDR